jgi:hypothetical protein
VLLNAVDMDEPTLPEVDMDEPTLPEVDIEDSALTMSEIEDPTLPEVDMEDPELVVDDRVPAVLDGLLTALLPKAVFLMQILSVEIIGVLKCLEILPTSLL